MFSEFECDKQEVVCDDSPTDWQDIETMLSNPEAVWHPGGK
jgi:hypothetical protein